MKTKAFWGELFGSDVGNNLGGKESKWSKIGWNDDRSMMLFKTAMINDFSMIEIILSQF